VFQRPLVALASVALFSFASFGACVTWPEYEVGGVVPLPIPNGAVEVPTTDAALPPCKDAPTTNWSTPTKLDKVHGVGTSANVLDPYVLPDGLTLLFTATDSKGWRRIHVATRLDTNQPFEGGTLLGGLDTEPLADQHLDQPAASSPLEIFFVGPTNDFWIGLRGTRTDPVTPKKLTEPALNTIDQEALATLSGDGTRMVFSRKVGTRFKLFEATRTDGSPGGTWLDVKELSTVNNPGWDSVCPALSANGNTLFFATNELDPASSATTVYVSTRTSPTSPFGGRTPVPGLGASKKLTCPRAIRDDGCELYMVSDRDGDSVGYVSLHAH